MTTPLPRPATGDPLRGWAPAGALLGVGWWLVGGVIGIVVRFGVPTPAELLVDVNGARGVWVAAMGLQTAQQILLVPFLLALLAALRPTDSLQVVALAAFGFSAVCFAISGIVHGVFGVHQAADTTDIAELTAAQIDLATVTHAIADTSYFAGIVATAVATGFALERMRRLGGFPAHLLRIGWVAVVCHGLQFGWFFVAAMGGFGAAGGVLQGLWFIAMARWLSSDETVRSTRVSLS
ncbi:MAG: hypothetical protein AAGA90_15120 [Actinomycetota bacterium]